VADDVGDDLLVREAEREGALVAVFQAEQDVQPAASRLVQQLLGHERGHKQLNPADAVALLAHDLLDFADDAPAERQVSVDACGEFADEAPAQQQAMARQLRLGGRLTQGRHKVVRCSHRVLLPPLLCRH
jgi:hypothetical protein